MAAVPSVPVRERTALGHALPRIGAWVLGFALVGYLAAAGGGYDDLVRSDVGIALWWMVLVGALVGALSMTGLGRPAWTVVALLAGLTLWTAISISWSGSAERSLLEAGRVATYLGAFVLALATQRRVGGRAMLNGVGAAIAGIAALAVLSRLHPTWFPTDQVAAYLGDNGRRLNYPLNYWNGLACFVALGLPLMCVAVRSAATRAGRSLAAAALPVMTLCIYLTVSRGGILAGVAGFAVLVALLPGRFVRLVALAPAALGSAILVSSVAQRHDLRTDMATATALHQGRVVLLLCLVVVAGVALLQVTVDAAITRLLEPWAARRGGLLRGAAIALAAVVLVGVLAGGVPGRAAHDWRAFKSPDTPETIHAGEDVFARLGNPAGNGRYQYWMSAKQAGLDHPLTGLGAGTFEFHWTEHPSFDGPYIRHAHSLWLETFGELGLPGALLVIAAFLTLLGAGVVRAVRAPPGERVWRAAAVAGLATFCVFVTYDWVWNLPVIPIAALLLGAVALGPMEALPRRAAGHRGRWAIAGLAIAALVAIAAPLGGVSEVRASQTANADGKLGTALADARSAVAAEPYAASTHLQEALVLEELGQFEPALQQARKATRLETDNWKLWLVRSRLAARTGAVPEALSSYRRARHLNPTSPIFHT